MHVHLKIRLGHRVAAAAASTAIAAAAIATTVAPASISTTISPATFSTTTVATATLPAGGKEANAPFLPASAAPLAAARVFLPTSASSLATAARATALAATCNIAPKNK